MLIPTYFCDCCGHAFSLPVKTFMREKCPKCGDFNFELLIPEKGSTVGKIMSSPVTLREYVHKTQGAIRK